MDTNAAQAEYWNAEAGQTWARFQNQLDLQLAPLGEAGLRALAVPPGARVLDIGCGCGQTSVALARLVGQAGAVTGVDLSRAMLAVARARAVPAAAAATEFLELDAQSGALGQAVYDAAFSRFGVMFFEDPEAAFRNILGALKPGGRLAFVCWRPIEQNIWMRGPLEAALPLLPLQAPPEPDAPGPFAFAAPARVRGLLERAGFSGISIAPYDAEIGGHSLEDALELALRVGPLGRELRENPALVERVTGAVRGVLAAHLQDGVVRMPAAVWVVTAQRASA